VASKTGKSGYARRQQQRGDGPPGELVVVQVAKELVEYVMDVTHRSPKEYRFDYAARLRGYALDVLEYVFTANGLYVGPGGAPQDAVARRSFQQRAITRAKLLAYVAQIATTQDVILPKQLAEIGRLTTACQRLVGGWIASDARRVRPASSGYDGLAVSSPAQPEPPASQRRSGAEEGTE